MKKCWWGPPKKIRLWQILWWAGEKFYSLHLKIFQNGSTNLQVKFPNFLSQSKSSANQDKKVMATFLERSDWSSMLGNKSKGASCSNLSKERLIPFKRYSLGPKLPIQRPPDRMWAILENGLGSLRNPHLKDSLAQINLMRNGFSTMVLSRN